MSNHDHLSPPADSRISLMRSDNRPARILHCDDVPEVRAHINIAFQVFFKDYELTECETGRETLREVARCTPDLLITDCCHADLNLLDTLPHLSRGTSPF